jgi:hypothetical protein
MGPRGPVTSLPTLNRVREGPKCQGLRRVVTDTVTTLAGDADVPGVVGRAVSSAGSRAHHMSRLSRCGSRMGTTTDAGLGGPASRLSGRRSSRHPSGAVGTAWRPIYARSGSSRNVRSPMTGRASSSDDAARLRCCYFSSLPVLPGRSTPMRLSSAAPGYLNPGTLEGSRTENTQAGVNPVHSEDDPSVAGSGRVKHLESGGKCRAFRG